MPTPSSSAEPFASVADWLERYDWRTIDQLCSDDEGPNYQPARDPEVAKLALASHPRALACLLDAAGMIEAACGVANQYTPDDLAALEGVGLGLLKRLNCDLAIGLLFYARPDRKGEPPKNFEKAEEALERLRLGQMVFGLLGQKEAGEIDTRVEPASEVEARDGPSVVADRYFGRRVNRRR